MQHLDKKYTGEMCTGTMSVLQNVRFKPINQTKQPQAIYTWDGNINQQENALTVFTTKSSLIWLIFSSLFLSLFELLTIVLHFTATLMYLFYFFLMTLF
jgi:hypothetical protein